MRGAWLPVVLALAAGCGTVGFSLGKANGPRGLSGGPAPQPRAEAPRPPGPEAEAPAETRPARAPAPEDKEKAALLSVLRFVETQQNSYRISAADLMEITVYQESDLNRQARVSPEGIVTFPLVGEVKVAGLSVAEAENALRQRLRRFLVDPQVSVFIREYGNKQVYVLGEVKRPGSYPLPTEAPLTVIEAITLAGGFTEYAAVDHTRVIRKFQGQSEAILVEVSAITKRGDKSKDVELRPNDVIFIPESFF